ncbi:MAG: Gfo/Idh/MocA family oxidoreductase [Flavobacteriales bacterium]|nr:Gfo/Idh/MocA family oxidoreductase [Flavobacteriales bacterium]
MKRSEFIKLSAGLGAFFSLPTGAQVPTDQLNELLNETKGTGSAVRLAVDPIPTVNVAVIGIGNRGKTLLDMFELLIKNGQANVSVICDLSEEKVAEGFIALAGKQTVLPEAIAEGPEGWKQVVEREDVDLVVICTPWELHAEMALYAMEQGKHVASEVPAAYTLEDCWKIIQLAEEKQVHHIMLENCCYNDEELWVLQMISEGVFGDLTHAECAYIHDLRQLMIDEKYYHERWRLYHHEDRNGNLYTTHGLGPVAMYFDIGRGDYFSHLVSMSSREAALSAATAGTELPQQFAQGDINTTLIRTFGGKTIMLQFDTHTGRPYSRINTVCGTKAVHQGYPSKLYLDHGPTWDWHQWVDDATYTEYRERYKHPFWKTMGDEARAKSIGHGGMDFIMMWRLIDCLNKGLALDLNVYDGILWSAITPLSELSVAQNSSAVQIPDFTSTTWKQKRGLEIMRK